jgi:hypothetical protein
MHAAAPNARRCSASLAIAIAFGIALVLAPGAGPGAADAATILRGTPVGLLAHLATRSEHRTGYSRSLFPTWSDADGDGCNTRYEVLIAESLTPVHVGRGCYLTGGKWRSVYDGYVSTDPTRFQIDHVVALEEAWASGAWAWAPARRKAYANDLGDGRTLRAVSISANMSKGDLDPADWLPPLAGFRCTYAVWWVDIKTRWGLSVDPAERAALSAILGRCPATIQTVAVK